MTNDIHVPSGKVSDKGPAARHAALAELEPPVHGIAYVHDQSLDKVRPAASDYKKDYDQQEIWIREPSDYELRGIYATRETPDRWSVRFYMGGWVEPGPLQREMIHRISDALYSVDGVCAVFNRYNDLFVVEGRASGEALVKAVGEVVDDLVPRVEALRETYALWLDKPKTTVPRLSVPVIRRAESVFVRTTALGRQFRRTATADKLLSWARSRDPEPPTLTLWNPLDPEQWDLDRGPGFDEWFDRTGRYLHHRLFGRPWQVVSPVASCRSDARMGRWRSPRVLRGRLSRGHSCDRR
jgi:hypothetical protein